MLGFLTEAIKTVGMAGANTIVNDIIDKSFSKDDAKYIKWVIYNRIDYVEIENRLKTIIGAIDDVSRQVEESHGHQIFQGYTAARNDFDAVMKTIEFAASEAEKRKVYADVLVNGKLTKIICDMVVVLENPAYPAKVSTVQELSNALIAKMLDVYSYNAPFDILLNDLKLHVGAVLLMRQIAIQEGYVAKDFVLGTDVEKLVGAWRVGIDNVLGTAPILRDDIDELVANKTPVRIVHEETGGCITAYANGSPLDKGKPRFGGKYQYGTMGQRHDFWGMPQVFLYPVSEHAVEQFDESAIGEPLTDQADPGTAPRLAYNQHKHTIVMDKESQGWVISKDLWQGQTRLLFRHVKSGKYLAGTNQGRVYLNDGPDGSHWWIVADTKPQPDSNARKPARSEVALLRSFSPGGYALDSDGTRVYAEGRQPDFSNSWMKWRFHTIV